MGQCRNTPQVQQRSQRQNRFAASNSTPTAISYSHRHFRSVDRNRQVIGSCLRRPQRVALLKISRVAVNDKRRTRNRQVIVPSVARCRRLAWYNMMQPNRRRRISKVAHADKHNLRSLASGTNVDWRGCSLRDDSAQATRRTFKARECVVICQRQFTEYSFLA